MPRGFEKVEREGVFFRGEIEDPQDVDHGEDEPAGCDSIERGKAGKYGLIDTDDDKDKGNGAKCDNLEAMHRYGVRRIGVQ